LWNPGSGTFGCDDWTGRSGAPLAAGDPTAMATNGQQHAFYRSVTGSVIHILWQAGLNHPRWDDWTFRSGSAAVEGNISGFRSSEGPDPLAVRVLALGDSMTEGYAIQRTGGYRAPLFHKAHSAGKHIVFVGSRFDGPPKVDGVCFPRAHEGHSGQNIDFIASLIPQVLTSKPKIVLLMIGANDVLRRGDLDYDAASPRRINSKKRWLDEAPTRLDDLLGKLIAADPGVLIVVAKIPRMNPRDPKTLLPRDWDESVRNYNAGVDSVVRQRVVAGARVALVDLYCGFTLAMLGTDGIHPNDIGYEHIATVWYQAISGHLT
jgi:lysophospholipase L1-like esterase